ncbi:M48 family metallopeptidase [Nocardioides sp. zg-536]|uniref:M48 family metallopeptidase n=1 Tax=Nocardioides faecalis TaxID=2803858 RepID=A0A938Y9A1_9ACTN|nr:M48 family metallopeptidase [Nocardioides faecalis]MBM9461542.1 M48 family metallopeptidase [Nocardioides faecalis]MBS4752548.1 M48 family metallopeptidase [Nocardioides faecalis]QVI57832.1 M48 family metallopeptidase [Nocardioides faecalis]
MTSRTPPRVEIRRSARRRRTVTAYREGTTIVVLMPADLTGAEERAWVSKMVARIERRELRDAGPRRWSDAELMTRAQRLSDDYLGGLAVPDSVRWVANQRSRWGSCTPSNRSIRLSERLQRMPEWVIDYVLVHELAHLIEPHHNDRFWGWVAHYPEADKAKGYLAGWSDGARIPRPPSDDLFPLADDVD